jgi:hypothetical protein
MCIAKNKEKKLRNGLEENDDENVSRSYYPFWSAMLIFEMFDYEYVVVGLVY